MIYGREYGIFKFIPQFILALANESTRIGLLIVRRLIMRFLPDNTIVLNNIENTEHALQTALLQFEKEKNKLSLL